MGIDHRIRRFIIAAGATTLVLAMSTAAMGTECKGMEQAACEAQTGQCYWVDPYTRKDGVEVSGHCRKKPGKKSGDSES